MLEDTKGRAYPSDALERMFDRVFLKEEGNAKGEEDQVQRRLEVPETPSRDTQTG